MSFTIAGFINAYLLQMIQASMRIRFYFISDAGYDSANRIPCNTHVLGDSRFTGLLSHPGCRIFEALGEIRVMESPWNIRGNYTVFRAADPWRISADSHNDAGKVKGTPFSVRIHMIIAGTSAAAERAPELMGFLRPGVNAEVFYSLRIHKKFCIFHNNVLDI